MGIFAVGRDVRGKMGYAESWNYKIMLSREEGR